MTILSLAACSPDRMNHIVVLWSNKSDAATTDVNDFTANIDIQKHSVRPAPSVILLTIDASAVPDRLEFVVTLGNTGPEGRLLPTHDTVQIICLHAGLETYLSLQGGNVYNFLLSTGSGSSWMRIATQNSSSSIGYFEYNVEPEKNVDLGLYNLAQENPRSGLTALNVIRVPRHDTHVNNIPFPGIAEIDATIAPIQENHCLGFWSGL